MLVFLLVFSYICIVIIAVITSKEIRGNTINRLDLAATKSGLFNFMETEIWKDIPDYEGLYQISSLGRVKSFKYGKEKLLKNRLVSSGYLMVILSKNNLTKQKTIHQLVAESFYNHTSDGTNNICVDHINNIKTDNRVENLQIVTHRYNMSKDRKGSSKYTGVSWHKQSLKWRASIGINKKIITLGYFNDEIEAAQAYKNALSAISIPS